VDGATISLLLGALFLLISVVGGGFQAKEIQIPRVPGRARLGALIVGLVFCLPFANRELVGWRGERSPTDELARPADQMSDTGDPGRSTAPPPKTETLELATSYLVDRVQGNVVVVTKASDNTYRLEHHHQAWPWVAEVELDGRRLTGPGTFLKSKAAMRVDGELREDGTIVVAYRFTRDDHGQPTDRVDNHVWVP
jgi:hypothetical protein